MILVAGGAGLPAARSFVLQSLAGWESLRGAVVLVVLVAPCSPQGSAAGLPKLVVGMFTRHARAI